MKMITYGHGVQRCSVEPGLNHPSLNEDDHPPADRLYHQGGLNSLLSLPLFTATTRTPDKNHPDFVNGSHD